MSTKSTGVLRRRRIARLAAFQDGLCFHCAQPMRLLETDRVYTSEEANEDDVASFDHVVPREAGGTNRIDNIVIAHRGCNSARRNAPLTAEALDRVALLNERRRPLIDEEAGAQCASTFGIASPAAILLVKVLDGLEGREGRNLRRSVNSMLSKFQDALASLRHVPKEEHRRHFSGLLLQETKARAERLEDAEVRRLTLNVVVAMHRRFSEVPKKPGKVATAAATRETGAASSVVEAAETP